MTEKRVITTETMSKIKLASSINLHLPTKKLITFPSKEVQRLFGAPGILKSARTNFISILPFGFLLE